MELMREVVESFIRLVKAEIHPNAVLVSSEDVFEVTKTPSFVLQGPMITENADRRTLAKMVTRHSDELTYDERNHPRLYHLDFDLIATTATEGELLDLMEKVARFYQLHPVLPSGLSMTELVPLGGFKRVNLSNLRQASGRCRIEDCPVYDGKVRSGRLATGIRIETNLYEETESD